LRIFAIVARDGGTGRACWLRSTSRNFFGPQLRRRRRSRKINASIFAGVRCGQRSGRRLHSRIPATPNWR
jgi:hypothetical protein